MIENGFERHLFVQKKSVQIIEDQYLNQKIQQEKIKVHVLEEEEKTAWFAYKNELLMIGKQKILFFDQNTGNDFSKIDLDILVDENTAKGSNNTLKPKTKRKFVLQGQKENHE